MRRFALAALLLAIPLGSRGSEQDALNISNRIWQIKMPYGTVMNPIFEAAGSGILRTYDNGGDSAIWTGHYLAAESYRYAVTRDIAALNNIRNALTGIENLRVVTGTGLLARFYMPTDTPYVEAMARAVQDGSRFEGTLNGAPHYFIAYTSRDQYSGIMFGLSVVFELVDDPGVRTRAANEVTQHLNFLIQNNWNVVNPDGHISTTFWGRPDQQLAFLQIGRQVNPNSFALLYIAHRALYGAEVPAPIAVEIQDPHGSYYKFNLNHINLLRLIQFEEPLSPYRAFYRQAYDMLRGATGNHQNAHFNMTDRALKAPDSIRDGETASLLDQWLTRPATNVWVDHRGDPRYPRVSEDRSSEW